MLHRIHVTGKWVPRNREDISIFQQNFRYRTDLYTDWKRVDSYRLPAGAEQFSAHEREELTETEFSQEGQTIIPLSECEDPLHYEDPVMHISGTGHWFLEGWIGDHSVEFLVDSGSSVTAMSDILYKNLVRAGDTFQWVHFRLQQGRCAARMEPAPDVGIIELSG